jgi:hypothetical protein
MPNFGEGAEVRQLEKSAPAHDVQPQLNQADGSAIMALRWAVEM